MQLDLPTLRRFFAEAPFMADLGAEPVDVREGFVASELTLQPRHFQHTAQVHAGVMVTLADHSMGAAAQTMAPEGYTIITAELSIRLLRAATGEQLLCEARVLKPGRLVSFTEADVWCLQGDRRVHVMRVAATMALVAAERLK